MAKVKTAYVKHPVREEDTPTTTTHLLSLCACVLGISPSSSPSPSPPLQDSTTPNRRQICIRMHYNWELGKFPPTNQPTNKGKGHFLSTTTKNRNKQTNTQNQKTKNRKPKNPRILYAVRSVTNVTKKRVIIYVLLAKLAK